MPVVMELTRGSLVETVYRGDAAVVDGSGRLLFQVGDGKKVTFWRSAAKPIQALPILQTGAADAFGFRTEHLAIFAASHNGEPIHVQTVNEALQMAGLSHELLQCGAHSPFDRPSAEALKAVGAEPQTVHNNCSGKHTGMLALAAHLGLSLADYLDPQSALQRRILADLADVVGLAPDQIVLGTDGCGVPVFGMPLANMAYAYARLAGPDHMPPTRRQAAQRMRDAMMRHPYLIGGRKRICTELMSLEGGRFIAKSGAEGVYSVGILPEAAAASPVLRKAGAVGGVGITVKVEDGNSDARHLMVVEILRQLGLLTEQDLSALVRYRPGPIHNWAGTEVGQRRAPFVLEKV